MAAQSQTLSLSQVQQLQMVLAPQLRQSLEMLQAPILELRTMLQEELEKNPTIEEVPTDSQTVEIEPGTGEQEQKEELDFDKEELDFDKEFEVLAKLDDEWRDYFFQNIQSNPYTQEAAEKRQFLLDSLPQRESLQEHLLNQLHLAALSEADGQIGELIIGSLNDDGYLTANIEDLAASASVDQSHFEDILAIVQDFHPTGVAAANLRECLLLQLERLGKKDSLEHRIVDNYIDKLGSRKYPDIARALKVSAEEVQKAARMIATLDPKPGRVFSEEVATYVLPEVVVSKDDGEFMIVLNDDQLPHVRISKHYREMLSNKSVKPEVKNYIRERIRAGAFLIKSIHQRQTTIRRIAAEIVERQKEFLEHGVSHLKPLTMAEVAKTVGVHETTVSRTVNAKYMQTPIGIYEMKYFFTPGIKVTNGQEISNKAVKDIIANMVAAEDPSKPLSDQDIVAKLNKQGINIARRTIAKYRLVLHIPPSHMRKSY